MSLSGVPNRPMEFLQDDDNAIFLFADMVGFTERTDRLSPKQITNLLNDIYSGFYEIISKFKAEEINVVKLMGDCIILCGSSDNKTIRKKQPRAMIEVGLAMLQFLLNFNKLRIDDPIDFRIGIHVGPAIKIRLKHPEGAISFDWIGKGINYASRMESSGLPGQLQISSEMYELVKSDFNCSKATHRIKTYGEQDTFFVVHRRPSFDLNQGTSTNSYTPYASLPQRPPLQIPQVNGNTRAASTESTFSGFRRCETTEARLTGSRTASK